MHGLDDLLAQQLSLDHGKRRLGSVGCLAEYLLRGGGDLFAGAERGLSKLLGHSGDAGCDVVRRFCGVASASA